MLSNNLGQAGSSNEAIIYVTLLDSGAEAKDRDFKVEKLAGEKFLVTDMESGASKEIEMTNFNYEHNSLIKMGDKSG